MDGLAPNRSRLRNGVAHCRVIGAQCKDYLRGSSEAIGCIWETDDLRTPEGRSGPETPRAPALPESVSGNPVRNSSSGPARRRPPATKALRARSTGVASGATDNVLDSMRPASNRSPTSPRIWYTCSTVTKSRLALMHRIAAASGGRSCRPPREHLWLARQHTDQPGICGQAFTSGVT